MTLERHAGFREATLSPRDVATATVRSLRRSQRCSPLAQDELLPNGLVRPDRLVDPDASGFEQAGSLKPASQIAEEAGAGSYDTRLRANRPSPDPISQTPRFGGRPAAHSGGRRQQNGRMDVTAVPSGVLGQCRT